MGVIFRKAVMAHYHFIGIGGMGMGKLASLLLSKGESISGSDITDNRMVESLRDQGARIFIGHDAKNIQNAEYVIYSSAIKENNPEVMAAQQSGCRILRRAELLAELMRDYHTITVAGAHGKTTTTSMIAHVLVCAGIDPTVALGGVFQKGSYEERLGEGEYFVAELDESDGSFLFFSPKVSVITNIDFEHVDYYGDWKNILKSYERFIGQTSPEGIVIAYGEDQRLRMLLENSGKQVIYYGLDHENDFYAEAIFFQDGKIGFECWRKGDLLGQVSLAVLGEHNVLNALGCIAAGLHIGLSFSDIADALASYQGVCRRFECKGKWDDIILFDDYAHHPTEIRSTLKAARMLDPKRIIAIFQPHRYTRIKFLWEDFKDSFKDADILLLTDIYAASEEVLPDINVQSLCEGISEKSCCQAGYVKKENITEKVLSIAQAGDLIMTLGAGDITKISDQIAKRLTERFAAGHE